MLPTDPSPKAPTRNSQPSSTVLALRQPVTIGRRPGNSTTQRWPLMFTSLFDVVSQFRGQVSRLHAECYKSQCRGQSFLLNVSMRNFSHGVHKVCRMLNLQTFCCTCDNKDNSVQWNNAVLQYNNIQHIACSTLSAHMHQRSSGVR